MKDFLKIMLASALGFIIANIIFSLIAMIFFFGMMGSLAGSFTAEKYVLEENSILNLKLNGPINERVAEMDPFTELLAPEGTTALGLNDIISAIRKAKNNDMIKGIYIDSR